MSSAQAGTDSVQQQQPQQQQQQQQQQQPSSENQDSLAPSSGPAVAELSPEMLKKGRKSAVAGGASPWMMVKDDKTDQTFYYNVETHDTSWVNPNRAVEDLNHSISPEVLVKAAEEGDTETLQAHIEAGADLNAAHNGYTPLLMASFCGQLYVVEMLIEAGVDINAHSQDDEACTALHSAAQSKDIELAQLLIRHKAEVNVQSRKGTTPLLLAAQEGATNLVKILIDLKADCEIADVHGVTPFYYAASENNVEMAQLLIDHKANVNHVATGQISPFEVAVKHNNVDVVKLLIANGCSPATLPGGEDAAVLTKLHNGELQLLAVLLKHGLDAECTNPKGWTAFIVAAATGDLDAVDVLAPYANVNRINPVDGECALSLAVQSGDVVMVEKLLALSCDVNALNPTNMWTPLHHAAHTAHLPIMEALLDSSANVNDKTDSGATPVMLAVQKKHHGCVVKLIDAQCNVEIYDDAHVTPLDVAIRNSFRGCIKALLGAQPKPDRKNADGRIPLEHALHIRLNHAPKRDSALVAIELLISSVDFNRQYMQSRGDVFLPQAIEAGDSKLMKIVEPFCDLNKPDSEGYTPLLVAVENNRYEIVDYLCQRGNVQLNAALKTSGVTALHLACRNGFAEIVTTLLYAGADANVQSALGVTPLLQATQAGRSRIVREILVNGLGVDINYAIPTTGWTALMCAVDEGHVACAELLLKMKADVSHCTPHGINALSLAVRKSRTAEAQANATKHTVKDAAAMVTVLKSHGARLPEEGKIVQVAPKLQSLARGFQVRLLKNRNAAALTIQRTVKGFLTRKWLRRQNADALQIGRLARGFVTRRRMAQRERLKGVFERIRRQIATSSALTMSLSEKEKAATMLAAIVRGSKTRAAAQRVVTATLKIQKNWRAKKLRSYANVAKLVMRESNQLFASLREQTLQTKSLQDFAFLRENLQLRALKHTVDENFATAAAHHAKLVQDISNTQAASALSPRPGSPHSTTGSALSTPRLGQPTASGIVITRSLNGKEIPNAGFKSQYGSMSSFGGSVHGFAVSPAREEMLQEFKNEVVRYREQAIELTRQAISACIAHLRAAVVPMGEVMRSGQLQKHLPPSIVQDCDIRGTWSRLNAAQDTVQALISACGCESIKSKVLDTRAQDRWANNLGELCSEVQRIDEQIERLVEQSRVVEARIDELSRRLQKSRRLRLQQKNKQRHFEREHKRFVAMCRVWWKVGRALRQEDAEDQKKLELAQRAKQRKADAVSRASPTTLPSPVAETTRQSDDATADDEEKDGSEEENGAAPLVEAAVALEWDFSKKALAAKPAVAEEMLDPWTAAQRGLSVEHFSKILDRENRRAAARGDLCWDLNQPDLMGATVLHVAAWRGHLHLVRFLLDYDYATVDAGKELTAGERQLAEAHKAQVNKLDHRLTGHSPVLLAARAGHHEIVEYLLKRGAEIDGTDMLGCTVLHHAVRKRSRRTVDAILAYEPLPESASVDVDDEYDGVADVEERQASFWRMLCVQDNKGKYAHQLAAQVCGPDSMITKKVNWAVSRVPKDVRPYGMMRGDRQRHAGLEARPNKPLESIHAARDRLLLMALRNQEEEEQALRESSKKEGAQAAELSKLRGEGVLK